MKTWNTPELTVLNISETAWKDRTCIHNASMECLTDNNSKPGSQCHKCWYYNEHVLTQPTPTLPPSGSTNNDFTDDRS